MTRLLGIDLPVLAGGTMAAALAVSEGGGLGVVEAGAMNPDALAAVVEAVRAGTERPFAVRIPLERATDRLGAVPVRVMVTFGHDPGRGRPAAIWLHEAGTVSEAVAAAGADGLVVVGEAGAAPPFGLVRGIVRALPATPLVVAGGADGAELAALLALGAGAIRLHAAAGDMHAGTLHRVAREYEAALRRLPRLAVPAAARSADRTGREAAALRENLLKRKNQARARSEP